MILENHVDLPADPDTVFALINDVERVATCLPGATLDGKEGDAYAGRVKFKVGPVSAAYAGTVRFADVDTSERRLRLLARGADSHGNGDAEADVVLTVREAPGGAALDLRTDLSIRGKIAQFGKGAITTVSNRLLDQFAGNLAALLQGQPAGPQCRRLPSTAQYRCPRRPVARRWTGWPCCFLRRPSGTRPWPPRRHSDSSRAGCWAGFAPRTN